MAHELTHVVQQRDATLSTEGISRKDDYDERQIFRAPQPKLAVSSPGDEYEREADRVADQVMRMSNPSLAAVQRKCGPCAAEEEQKAQRKVEEGAPAAATSAVANPHGGEPLSPGVRAFFEPRLQRDLSAVHVHTGAEAASAARSIHALAYTVGTDIVFGSGQYEPSSEKGRHLLAHELTHVVQQAGTESRVQRQAAPTGTSGPQSVEEFFVCLIICMCNEAPGVGIAGQMLKQVCVSEVLDAVDFAMNNTSPIKAEVSYDMTKTPPSPIMSGSKPGKKKAWIPDYIDKYMPGFKANKGLIRRPDVVIVHSGAMAPGQKNIKKVIEIKFPGDILSEAQREAYTLIAGSAEKFGVLTPENCQCERLKQVLLEALEIIAEMIVVSAVAAALAADDATLIGIFDDVLLVPLGARLTSLLARLYTLVPRVAPLFAPAVLK